MYTVTGGTDTRHLVEQHMGLVKKLAGILKSRLPANVELDDLIQSGTIGLWEAARNFDTAHEVQFETYASQRIRGAMLDELRGSDWAPRRVRAQMREIEVALATLRHELGRAPGEGEVARHLGMGLVQYQEALAEAAGAQLVYLEDLSGQEDDAGFLERFAGADSADPLSVLLDEDMRCALAAAIAGLPEREKLLMGLYYEQDLNLREIGAVLGVSEARVSQMHTQAVARLRTQLRGK